MIEKSKKITLRLTKEEKMRLFRLYPFWLKKKGKTFKHAASDRRRFGIQAFYQDVHKGGIWLLQREIEMRGF